MPNIVTVSVSQQVASAPSMLQQTGALISQGATTLANGGTQLLTQISDLTAILKTPINIASISWSAGVVTVNTVSAHTIPTGQVVQGTIAGAAPSGYDGTFACTGVTTTQFTYPLASNPGSETNLGTFILADAAMLTAMATTYFGQGGNNGVYVLELGTGGTAAGVSSLSTYLQNPSIKFYSYLFPSNWDTETTAPTLTKQYSNTTSQTYFFVTTTTATYSNWINIKSVFAMLQSPSAPSTEFSAAAVFQSTLEYNPSASNLASPLAFSYLYGVTPYVLTNSLQNTLKAAGVNWVGTGAQGGISNTLVLWGTTMDVNPWNYWYSVDWTAINVAESLAAAVINGSNSPTNPLYYNQAGINTLQKVAQSTVNNGISFGLILSPAAVVAVPFSTYVKQQPGDYSTGTYNGLSCTFVPLRGFESITIYLTASNIPA
jgi:hypothetical protein